MKNVQISEELFVVIMRYFMLEQEEMLPQIKQGLEKKLDAMVMRELYTKYKTAPTEEEKGVQFSISCLTVLPSKNHFEPSRHLSELHYRMKSIKLQITTNKNT